MQRDIYIYYPSTNQKLEFLWELVTIVCAWAHHRKFVIIINNVGGPGTWVIKSFFQVFFFTMQVYMSYKSIYLYKGEARGV